MLGSLELLISGFPNSRLRLDQISHAFVGESAIGSFTCARADSETALFARLRRRRDDARATPAPEGSA